MVYTDVKAPGELWKSSDYNDFVAAFLAHGHTSFSWNTLYVAANDSTAEEKAMADYTCDGISDETEINTAITAAPAYSFVHLFSGHFICDGNITLKSDVVLEGSGIDVTFIYESTNNGVLAPVGAERTTFQDATLTGKCWWQTNASYSYVNRVKTYDLDNSWIGCFVVFADSTTLTDIYITDCEARDCDRWGYYNFMEGDPKWTKNSRLLRCKAINCGRYGHFDDPPGTWWDPGFVWAENNNIENVSFVDCYASGSGESGFHFDTDGGVYTCRNVSLIRCTSVDNGQKYKEGGRPWSLDDGYAAGFTMYAASGSSFYLEDCMADDNYIGYRRKGGKTTFMNCHEKASEKVGYLIYNSAAGGYSHTFLNCKSYESPEAPLRFYSGASPALIDGMEIVSLTQRIGKSAIKIDNTVTDPENIIIRNCSIDKYDNGINNAATKKCYCMNNAITNVTTAYTNCNVLPKREMWGAAAGVADGGSISHGLLTTPTGATCTCSVSGECASATTLDTDHFHVAIKKCTDGSAGTNQTIYWHAWVV